MQIELNPERTSMWFLNSEVHLTFADPGPASIDFQNLPRDQQTQVVYGLAAGKIKSKEHLETIEYWRNASQAPVPTQQIPVPKDSGSEPPTITPASDLEEEAKKILSGSAIQTKKMILQIDNARLLRILREVELGRKPKARKTVVSLLQSRITQHEKQVADNLKEAENTPIDSTGAGWNKHPEDHRVDSAQFEIADEPGEDVVFPVSPVTGEVTDD